MELYRRYRPKSLDKVVGNTATVSALRTMLAKKQLPHCILFHGPSGCGKTTLARILARELACSDLDLCEINAASTRGIDVIRDISNTMPLSPTGGTVRVWILDESHNLSKDAQHAALKIFEDTPRHAYFMLCTTEPGKLLPTIRTRCTEMPVTLLQDKDMEGLLAGVLRRERDAQRPGKVSEAVLSELVATAQGSARKALVLLDKIRGLPGAEQAKALAVASDEEQEAIELCRALIKRLPWSKVAKILKNLKGDPEQTRRMVLGYAKTTLLGGNNVQAFRVIQSFANPFYDTGEAGLVGSCFEAIAGE